MRKTKNSKELVSGKSYFCTWAWRSARYIGTRVNELGEKRAYFKDVCNCVISRAAETVMQDIDWEK